MIQHDLDPGSGGAVAVARVPSPRQGARLGAISRCPSHRFLGGCGAASATAVVGIGIDASSAYAAACASTRLPMNRSRLASFPADVLQAAVQTL